MSTRKNPQTSLDAYEKIKAPGYRECAYKWIILALEVIGKGNYEQIAIQAGKEEDVIWKRISEVRKMGIIIDTGERKPTKKGNDSMVYCLFNQREKYELQNKPEKTLPGKSIGEFAKDILSGNLKQKELFD